MIPFPEQRFCRFYRSMTSALHGRLHGPLHGRLRGRLRGPLRCLWLACLVTTPAFAQSGEELFRGTWQIETPERGTLIVILHNQGRAAYFWGDDADTTVYQGTWTSSAEVATLSWPDGSQHRIESDQLGFGATFVSANGAERYTSPAQQVPREVLGQWAKPPTRDSELSSNQDQAEGFFGIWRVGAEDSDEPHFVFVESDRSAASTRGGAGGLRGSWAKQGSELHIAWDSGHYAILRETRRGFAYKRIAPGAVIEDDTTEPEPAIRTNPDNVPATWLSSYETERGSFTGGIAFANRNNARNFYRGDWVIRLDEDQFERVEIKRFGGLATSLDRSLSGEWRMQGQDIFMRWDDGMRKILSPIGRGFVLYEYRPGRPLDGVPTRTRAAAPADTSKLADYAEEREDVTEQMRRLADAAGLDPRQQANSGWGRTFARWVWPFSEDGAATTSEAILEEEFEPTLESDPWWWPFWSEKTNASQKSDTGAKTKTLPETESKTSPKKRSSARDWVWPF